MNYSFVIPCDTGAQKYNFLPRGFHFNSITSIQITFFKAISPWPLQTGGVIAATGNTLICTFCVIYIARVVCQVSLFGCELDSCMS